MTHSTIMLASQASGLSVDDICGPSRLSKVCIVRFAVMDALSARGLSLTQVGRLLNRDHSSIHYGLRRVEALRGQDDFESIRSAIA